MVLEGLALSLQEYSLVTSSKDPNKATDISRLGKGTTEILELLAEVRAQRNQDWEFRKSIYVQYGDQFLEWTDRVKLPDFFKPDERNLQQVNRAWRA